VNKCARVVCHCCGNCCKLSDPIRIYKEDIERFAKFFKIPFMKAKKKYTRLDLVCAYIQSMNEHNCESRQVITRKEFIWLGLTDSVLLHETATADSLILLTDDFDLYLAASNEGYPVQNFTHLRKAAYE
jgi:hypothetical protein